MSQRRRNNIQRSSEGHDLTGQDQPLKDRDSGLWVPASAHQGDDYEDEDEEEEAMPVEGSTNGDMRGRTTESAVVA